MLRHHLVSNRKNYGRKRSSMPVGLISEDFIEHCYLLAGYLGRNSSEHFDRSLELPFDELMRRFDTIARLVELENESIKDS